jgi:hypothetical protein
MRMCNYHEKNYYIEIEISLLTKSGPHYSSSLNWENKRRTMIIFAKIYRFKYIFFCNKGIVLSLINLDLITIFSTLFKKKNYLTNIIIVLLFPIAAFSQSP